MVAAAGHSVREAYARIPEHILENAFDYLELLAKYVRRVNVIGALDKSRNCSAQVLHRP